MTQGAAVTDAQFEVLQRLKGSEVDRALLDQYMREHEKGPGAQVAESAVKYAEANGLERGALKAELAALQSPASQITDAGNAANFLLGNPAMAYSAVGAGGALGAVGALEAYNRWLASQQEQQQQAQKESQLPLS